MPGSCPCTWRAPSCQQEEHNERSTRYMHATRGKLVLALPMWPTAMLHVRRLAAGMGVVRCGQSQRVYDYAIDEVKAGNSRATCLRPSRERVQGELTDSVPDRCPPPRRPWRLASEGSLAPSPGPQCSSHRGGDAPWLPAGGPQGSGCVRASTSGTRICLARLRLRLSVC